jgi:hypothetical protein
MLCNVIAFTIVFIVQVLLALDGLFISPQCSAVFTVLPVMLFFNC